MTQYQRAGTSFWRRKQVAINFETQYQNAGRHLACVCAAQVGIQMRLLCDWRGNISHASSSCVCVCISYNTSLLLPCHQSRWWYMRTTFGLMRSRSCICGLQAVAGKGLKFFSLSILFSFTASEYPSQCSINLPACRLEPPALSQLYLTESFDA